MSQKEQGTDKKYRYVWDVSLSLQDVGIITTSKSKLRSARKRFVEHALAGLAHEIMAVLVKHDLGLPGDLLKLVHKSGEEVPGASIPVRPGLAGPLNSEDLDVLSGVHPQVAEHPGALTCPGHL